MVEEAAGTCMFEERKDKAKKTMGKKEKRVDEITALLAEEITPKLDMLRTERHAFMQYQKAGAELECLAHMKGRTIVPRLHERMPRLPSGIATLHRRVMTRTRHA